jgi:hypothetical protein
VGAADAVKDNVHALTREAVNFLHEVELSVVNRSGATTENPSFASPSGAAITSSCRPHRAWDDREAWTGRGPGRGRPCRLAGAVQLPERTVDYPFLMAPARGPGEVRLCAKPPRGLTVGE